jgi:hypothetical protein
MTKVLLSCCLVALLSGASVAHAALGTPARGTVAQVEARMAEAPRLSSPTRWPGLNWYLGMGCVSLLVLQRVRWFNPQRRQQHPRS